MSNAKHFIKRFIKNKENYDTVLYDLVRDQLKQDVDLNDYHFDNISVFQTENPPTHSPVHNNFAYAEAKLKAIFKAEATETLNVIDLMDYKKSVNWISSVDSQKTED
jgi:hypothetical protein